jgi:hypothetical protein
MPAAKPIDPTGKTGLGCLILFALPFAGAGVGAAIVAVNKASAGQWRDAGMLGLFALLFGGVGFGLMIGGIIGARKLKQTQALAEQFPDEPWRWREDWASGRIIASNRSTMLGAWVFAILWNGIANMIWFALPQELEKGNKAAYIGLIFPVIGLGLLIWAVRATLRWRKFGVVTLQLHTTPVALGGALSGLITTPGSLAEVRVVKLQLACVQREQRGKNSSDRLIWEDTQQLDAATLHVTTGIPVSFQLPREGPPTSPKQDGVSVTWQLEVKAETRGVDFGARFELPVFGVAPIDSFAPIRLSQIAEQQRDESISPNPNSRIRVETSAEGREFVFPATRNPGAALALTLFATLWTGVVWFLIVKRAPLIFPIVFGFFDLIFLLLVFSVWFGASRVVIGPAGLQRYKSGLLVKSRKKFLREEIKDIKLHIGMSTGTKAFYDLRVVTVFGRETAVATSIADKREAEWLAQQMKTALGLKPEISPAQPA